MSLHKLPVELLQHICTFLQPSPDLQSLSLVDQKCHSAAISIIFQFIHVQVEIPNAAFEQKLQSLTDILCSVGVENVRGLEIAFNQQISRRSFTQENCFISEEDGELDIYSSPKTIWNDEGNSPRETVKWLPLARFIERLPALWDFTWSHPARIPTAILTVLPSNCRLHLRMFCLGEDLSAAYQYTRDIAPVLSSVCVQFGSPKMDTFEIPETVMLFLEMVVRLAPRLREIRSCFRLGRVPSRHAREAELEREMRLLVRSVTLPFEKKLCRLQRLDLSGPQGVDAAYLRMWMSFVDFGCLRTIRLSNLTDDALMWLRLWQPLANLQVLMIHLNRYLLPEEEYYNNLNAFITSLPPLQALLLQGQYSFSNVEIIMQVHGHSLRKLWIIPSRDKSPLVFNPTSITTLRTQCPNLQDLRLTIRRTKGNPAETSIYKTLGSFPALTTLLLTLDCSNPYLLTPLPLNKSEPPFPPSMYPPGVTAAYPLTNRPTNSAIRDSLINAAIDSSLAHEIYTTISLSKPPSHSSHLTHLILHPVGAGTFANQCTLPGLPECFSQISRTFHIRRGGNGEVHIQRDEKGLLPWRKDMKLQRALWRIFEGIWKVEGEEDWRRVWRSFPLCEEREDGKVSSSQ